MERLMKLGSQEKNVKVMMFWRQVQRETIEISNLNLSYETLEKLKDNVLEVQERLELALQVLLTKGRSVRKRVPKRVDGLFEVRVLRADQGLSACFHLLLECF
jgi:hypothetical protein